VGTSDRKKSHRPARTSRDYLDIIEAAYSVERSPSEWLQGITDAGLDVLDQGLGVFAAFYDAGDPHDLRLESMVSSGASPATAQTLHEMSLVLRLDPSAVKTYYWGGWPVAQVTDLAPPSGLPPPLIELMQRVDMVDAFSVRTYDPSHRGMQVVVPQQHGRRLASRTRGKLGCIAAHLAAAVRLREIGPIDFDRADAVFGGQGGIEHIAPEVRDDHRIPSLRAGVARLVLGNKIRRESPEAAVELWRALVAGRWSIFRQLDTDGRRFIVARRNEVNVRNPRALTPDERRTALYAAWGHSLKLIAYEVGLAESTVSYHLKRALRKLGLRDRAELAGLLRSDDAARDRSTFRTSAR
jgi:DNA-binding CsgD family transcriptional regulator